MHRIHKFILAMGRFLDVRRYPQEQRRYFTFNIFLGIALTLVFFLLRDTAIHQDAINKWFDHCIRLRLDDATESKQASDQLVFLDFDDRSFHELNRPEMTPRDKIADLVRAAYQGKAALIFIDMDLSEKDYRPSWMTAGDVEPLSGTARDQILFATLKEIGDDPTDRTKVFLPITTFADGTIKKNEFAKLVDNHTIYGVTPTFTINQATDRITRFWLPYLIGTDPDTGNRCLLWSVPLLGLAVTGNHVKELEQLEQTILFGKAPSFTLRSNEGNPSTSENFVFFREQAQDEGILRNTSSDEYNRIQYTLLPPHALNYRPLGNIPPGHIAHWRRTGLDNERLDCQGKIAVIGRSDQDCADYFTTPLGNMPGMYIHGNSLATVLGKTQPHLTTGIRHMLLDTLLVVLASYVFLWFAPFRAECLILFLTGICLIFVYIFFCYTNEFLYLSFSFTAIGIHNAINRFEALLSGNLSLGKLQRRKSK